MVFAAALSTNSSLMRQTNLLMVDYPDNFNDTVRKSFLGVCDSHVDTDVDADVDVDTVQRQGLGSTLL